MDGRTQENEENSTKYKRSRDTMIIYNRNNNATKGCVLLGLSDHRLKDTDIQTINRDKLIWGDDLAEFNFSSFSLAFRSI